MRPAAVEFLVHMSLCAAVASINTLSTDGLIDRPPPGGKDSVGGMSPNGQPGSSISQSDHLGGRAPGRSAPAIRHHRVDHTSITGARLDLQWRQLSNVEYLTDGGNSWIHTAVFNGKPVVVKTLKPECQDVAVAINEIEGELGTFFPPLFAGWSLIDRQARIESRYKISFRIQLSSACHRSHSFEIESSKYRVTYWSRIDK